MASDLPRKARRLIKRFRILGFVTRVSSGEGFSLLLEPFAVPVLIVFTVFPWLVQLSKRPVLVRLELARLRAQPLRLEFFRFIPFVGGGILRN